MPSMSDDVQFSVRDTGDGKGRALECDRSAWSLSALQRVIICGQMV